MLHSVSAALPGSVRGGPHRRQLGEQGSPSSTRNPIWLLGSSLGLREFRIEGLGFSGSGLRVMALRASQGLLCSWHSSLLVYGMDKQ